MPDPPFRVVSNKRTHMVVETATGRCLGAVAVNFYRPYVFPLYTPRGYTVIQDGPPDHPWHTGIFVGQAPVVAGGREWNFWGVPPRVAEQDRLQESQGRMDAATPEPEPHGAGVRFAIRCVWRDEDGQPVLDELRTIDLHAAGEGTVCDMTSRKTAAYGPVRFPATKHGSVGVRVDPRLLPELGGVVLADEGRRGRADVVHEQPSTYVAYENAIDGGTRAGVLLTVLEDDVDGAWFVRDYGMAMYDSTLREEIALAAGESWSAGLRVVAYDGALTDERATGTWASG